MLPIAVSAKPRIKVLNGIEHVGLLPDEHKPGIDYQQKAGTFID